MLLTLIVHNPPNRCRTSDNFGPLIIFSYIVPSETDIGSLINSIWTTSAPILVRDNVREPTLTPRVLRYAYIALLYDLVVQVVTGEESLNHLMVEPAPLVRAGELQVSWRSRGPVPANRGGGNAQIRSGE